MMQIIKLDKNLKNFNFELINIFINYKFYLISFLELKDKAYSIFAEFNSNEEFVRFFAQFAYAPTYKKLFDNYFKSYIYDENEM